MKQYSIIDGVLLFSDECTAIPPREFKGDESITKIIFGKNITSIGEEAFSECISISEIEMPENGRYYSPANSNTIVEKETGILVFGCYTSKIDKDVREIGPFAFCGQTKLNEITIPGTCKKIGSSAFAGCSCLSNLILCDGVEEISTCAFLDCDNLQELTLPSTLKKVDDTALGLIWIEPDDFFDDMPNTGCFKISTVNFNGMKQDFYKTTNFNNLLIFDKCLAWGDMTVHCSDGDFFFSNNGGDEIPDYSCSSQGDPFASVEDWGNELSFSDDGNCCEKDADSEDIHF